MNNNKNDEPALLAGTKGVFAKTSYITVGTKEEPFPYVQHPIDRDSFKGKQMSTKPMKQGHMPETYFEQKHNYVSEGLPFVDRLRYAETQKDELKPKKGFCSSDFSRTDEFSSTCRTEQYRELLKQEGVFAKKAIAEAVERSCSKLPANAAQLASASQPQEVLLYDLVYEKPEWRGTGASKLRHDTKNRTWLSRLREMGPYRTTTGLAHGTPEAHDLRRPEYSNSIVEKTFSQKDNLCLV